VTGGLDAVLPKQRAYIDALTATSTLGGPLFRLEAGGRLTPRLGLFGFGEWSLGKEARAGVGARFTF
jgi:hypothetical protein